MKLYPYTLAVGLAFGLGHAAQPKNIILMISDGWGYNQVAAANYYTEGKDSVQAYE